MIAICHPNRFAQARNLCKNCYDKWLKDTNPQYKSSQSRNSNEWKIANPDKWEAIKERRKVKVKANPLYRREMMLIKKYGLTLEDYNAVFLKQNGRCALCYRQPGTMPLHVDHNHKTKVIRGLLCHQCNWYLGVVENDTMILSRIKDYLN